MCSIFLVLLISPFKNKLKFALSKENVVKDVELEYMYTFRSKQIFDAYKLLEEFF